MPELGTPGVKGSSVAIQHRQAILEQIARGVPISRIAKELGYSGHSGITERLGDDPDYQAALRAGIVGKIEQREAELESAPDNVSVTRADRLLGHARWWAERLDPARFGQRTQVDVNIDIGTALQALSERLSSQPIQGDCTVIAQDSDNLLIP